MLLHCMGMPYHEVGKDHLSPILTLIERLKRRGFSANRHQS